MDGGAVETSGTPALLGGVNIRDVIGHAVLYKSKRRDICPTALVKTLENLTSTVSRYVASPVDLHLVRDCSRFLTLS
jgi:hypothetical protein